MSDYEDDYEDESFDAEVTGELPDSFKSPSTVETASSMPTARTVSTVKTTIVETARSGAPATTAVPARALSPSLQEKIKESKKAPRRPLPQKGDEEEKKVEVEVSSSDNIKVRMIEGLKRNNRRLKDQLEEIKSRALAPSASAPTVGREDLEVRLKAKEKQIAALKARLQSAKAKHTELRRSGTMSMFAEKMVVLENRRREVELEVKSLSDENRSLTNVQRSMAKQIDKYEKEQSMWPRRLESAQQDLRVMKLKVEKAREAEARAATALGKQHEQMMHLIETNRDLQEELARLKGNTTQAKEERALKSQIATFDNERRDMEYKVAALERKKGSNAGRRDDKLRTAQARLRKLQSQVDSKSQLLAEKEKEAKLQLLQLNKLKARLRDAGLSGSKKSGRSGAPGITPMTVTVPISSKTNARPSQKASAPRAPLAEEDPVEPVPPPAATKPAQTGAHPKRRTTKPAAAKAPSASKSTPAAAATRSGSKSPTKRAKPATKASVSGSAPSAAASGAKAEEDTTEQEDDSDSDDLPIKEAQESASTPVAASAKPKAGKATSGSKAKPAAATPTKSPAAAAAAKAPTKSPVKTPTTTKTPKAAAAKSGATKPTGKATTSKSKPSPAKAGKKAAPPTITKETPVIADEEPAAADAKNKSTGKGKEKEEEAEEEEEEEEDSDAYGDSFELEESSTLDPTGMSASTVEK